MILRNRSVKIVVILKNMTPRTKDDFQLDYDRAEDRFTVTSTMNTAYRTHKNRMFQHYSVFNSKEEALEHPYPEMNKEEWTRVCDLFASEEFQRRSAINKENRAKLKIVHTSGARSFQRARALLEKMEALQLQYESEGKSYTEVEIFAEVLGFRPFSTSVGSSSSVSIPGKDHGLDYHEWEDEGQEWEDEGQEATLVTDQYAPDHQGRLTDRLGRLTNKGQGRLTDQWPSRLIDQLGRLTDQGQGRLTDQWPSRLTDQDNPAVRTDQEPSDTYAGIPISQLQN
ncbi:hypothetical protein CJ030_MR1G022547 [Morella rubra]|uniref:Uncharacterized protein n=1 Tax=Morella rubra TaxID=262757 RepID=A0A6A1WNJ7_9ROSI|nr:hypothetical protein CJ030_MR1G022547 [Morella rubra]